MSIILALETSSAKCSVAISNQAELISFEEIPAGYAHVSQLTILIDQCLSKAGLAMNNLNAIAISDGPGSYTGLRVGSSTAKGLCYALNIPLIAINTLDLIAEEHIRSHEELNEKNAVVAVIDARRDEVYAAAKNGRGIEIFGPKSMIIVKGIFDEMMNKYPNIELVGDSVGKCESILDNESINYVLKTLDARFLSIYASDRFIAQDFQNISTYTPFYLKPPNITVSKKQIFRKN